MSEIDDRLAKVETDCSEECYALSDREFRFHLGIVAGLNNGESYDLAILPKTTTAGTSSGARMRKRPHVRAALLHHRRLDTRAFASTKERSVERHVGVAEGANLTLFLDEDGVPSLEKILEAGDAARAIRVLEFSENGKIEKIVLHNSAVHEAGLARLLGWNKPDRVEHVDISPMLEEIERYLVDNPEDANTLRALEEISQPGAAVLEIYERWRAGQ